MDMKKLTMGVVAVTVAIVLVVACVIPIISDSVEAEDTFTNDGIYRMSKIDSTVEDLSITWDHTKPFEFTIGTETLAIANTPLAIPCSIVACDDWAIRYNITSNGTVYIDLYDSTSGSVRFSQNSSGARDVTLTLDEGLFTITDSVYTITESYTEVFVIDSDGDYVMKKSSSAAYLNSDSEIYGTGRTTFTVGGSSVSYNINLHGTVEDIDVTVFYPPEDVIVSDIVITSESVGSHNDLFKFNQVGFTTTESANVNNAVYSQVIVPYEVTAERSIHPDGVTTTVLSIVPVLIILGVIVGAVGLFIKTRRD